MLAVPPSGFFSEKSISIDDVLISEHILTLSYDGKEMTSLTGKSYKMEGEKKIVLDRSNSSSNTPKISVIIKSRDSFFIENDKSFKRLLISNCLD